MKSLDFAATRYTAASLRLCYSGCGGSQAPIAAPGAMPQDRSSGSYQVLYRFGSHGNPRYDIGGANPEGLIYVGGQLYGTTAGGGYHDFGTVYSMSTASMKTVLHRFGSGSYANDGVDPVRELIEVKSLLYGATYIGGKCGSGSIYSITTTGTESIVPALRSGREFNRVAGLVNLNGTLYGTTQYGRSTSDGTLQRYHRRDVIKTLHNFTNSPNDGAEPAAPLLDVKGTLYGTTVYGGWTGKAPFTPSMRPAKRRCSITFKAAPMARYPSRA